MECSIAYNGGPLFFVLPSTTFLQYPWPFSWDLLLADNFIVSHLQEKCMDDYNINIWLSYFPRMCVCVCVYSFMVAAESLITFFTLIILTDGENM